MCQKAAQEWRIIMGILTRFKDIMSANINALLDKCEDPEKMIDQYMRNLESDLGKVKAETASVMAEETRCKRELDECTADVAKYQSGGCVWKLRRSKDKRYSGDVYGNSVAQRIKGCLPRDKWRC